jgi:hypothetical protein
MKLSKINGELHFSEKKNRNPPLTRKIGDWIYHFYWLVKLMQNNHFQICLRCSLYFMYENTTVLKTVLRVPTIGLCTLYRVSHCPVSVQCIANVSKRLRPVHFSGIRKSLSFFRSTQRLYIVYNL